MRAANIRAWLAGGVYTVVTYVFDSPLDDAVVADQDVVTYDRDHPPPDVVARQLFGGGLLWRLDVLRWRLRRGDAVAFCMLEGDALRAFGWLQEWAPPHSKRFGWISDHGLMLGPYWTHTAWRGRGIYGRLIAHSVAVSEGRGPHLIFAKTHNTASRSGIEKAGFSPLCTFRLWLGPMRLWSRCRVLRTHSSWDKWRGTMGSHLPRPPPPIWSAPRND
jgi:GNAT superfamily N-acetyltransferase